MKMPKIPRVVIAAHNPNKGRGDFTVEVETYVFL